MANQNGAYRSLLIPKLTEVNVLGVLIGAIAGVACVQGWESQDNRDAKVTGCLKKRWRRVPKTF
jgi:hypothetical protein